MCVLVDGSIGLYKMKEKEYKSSYFRYRIQKYSGIDSENIGGVRNFYKDYDFTGARIRPVLIDVHVYEPGRTIERFGVVANVEFTSVMSYYDVRSFMKLQGLITNFDWGKATLEEMSKVLAFAQSITPEDAKKVKDELRR